MCFVQPITTVIFVREKTYMPRVTRHWERPHSRRKKGREMGSLGMGEKRRQSKKEPTVDIAVSKPSYP